MFEEDWLAAESACVCIGRLWDRATPRKLRLFCVAACRRIHDLLPDERCANAVAVATVHAEGEATFQELEAAWRACVRYVEEESGETTWLPAAAAAGAAFGKGFDLTGLPRDSIWRLSEREDPQRFGASLCSQFAAEAVGRRGGRRSKPKERDEHLFHAGLMRDVFNPYRRVPFDDSLRTPDVMRLAAFAYESHDFAVLPALADALEEAGCRDRWVLEHCRGREKCGSCLGEGATDEGRCQRCKRTGARLIKTPHIRGCWVVDLCLSKK